MDYLWSPWRYRYLTGEADRGDIMPPGCVFCNIAAQTDRDEQNLVLHRGAANFILLNRFPYTSGHLMVVPYAHAGELSVIDEDAAVEMMMLSRAAERHIRAVYRPGGINLGMNMGESAGAGIAGHIHMHVLPRWHGDANFMTTVGETRVLPEDLDVTWRRLAPCFQS